MKADIELKKMIPLLLSVVLIVAVALIIVFSGGETPKKKVPKATGTPTSTVDRVKHDSTCEGMITRIDTQNLEIAIYDFKFENTMVFSYTGGTHFTNKYGNALSVNQLYMGMIVEADYVIEDFKLVSLREHNDAWEYKKLRNFSYNKAKNQFVINGQDYRITDDLLVVSTGTMYALSDIISTDVLTVRGIGNRVWSVEITKGHGYLTLEGADELIGGVMYVNDKNHTITENMRVTLSEGNYTITFSKGKLTGEKKVYISRFNSTVLDVSDIFDAPKGSSQVEFKITPEKAVLYIDGEQRSYGVPIILEYGNYKIKVVKDGYNTYSGNIQVDDAGEVFTINLTKIDLGEEDEKEDEDKEDGEEKEEDEEKTTKEPVDSTTPTSTVTPTQTPKPTKTSYPTNTPQPTKDAGGNVPTPDKPVVDVPSVDVPTVPKPVPTVPQIPVPNKPTV
ncbi:MAG: PEGA domain-containing protein [Lachnospiraceae bacterium]|nr:PEGA domain-containing protein [Lachnospiraceae bacterium]